MNNWIAISITGSLLAIYLIYLLLIKETQKINNNAHGNIIQFEKDSTKTNFFQKNNTIHIDLDYAHTIINQIGLNSSDKQLVNQIKQVFIKNRRVTPDLIEHLALHYNMTSDELYTLIHYIIKEPLNC